MSYDCYYIYRLVVVHRSFEVLFILESAWNVFVLFVLFSLFATNP